MKNSYIHTSGLVVKDPIDSLSLDLYNTTKTSLISLIEALGSINSGYDTVTKMAKNLNKFKANYLDPNKAELFIDSGGYSIVKGDVAAFNLTKFTNCYNYYLETEQDNYNYIFSLDVASFINDVASNTKEIIYNLNKNSLIGSIKIIKQNPIIKDKFIFVLHFKDIEQYKIFDKLYDELEVYNYSKYFSIGGLVSLNSLTDSQLDFAPFIGCCYWSLYQYFQHSNYSYPLYIHILGIYWRSFRFTLYFIEELFSAYLFKHNQSCEMSYDSINYTITSLFKAQVGFPVQYLNENDLEEYDTIFSIPDYVIDKIYSTNDSRIIFDENLAAAKSKKRLNNLNYLVNLNTFSQLELDKFFIFIIRKYKLVEMMIDSNCNYNQFKNNSNFILNSLPAKYKCISNQHIKQIQNSLKYIFAFHNWYIKDQSKAKFDELMELFIKKINFRYSLS